jgi:hypothetical protein
MRPRSIVIVRIRSKQRPKMPLVKYANIIKAIPSDRTDEPLTIAILPWQSRRGCPIPNAHRRKTPDEDIAVGAVPIANEIAWPLLPAVSLRQLATYPFGAWMLVAQSHRISRRPCHRISNPYSSWIEIGGTRLDDCQSTQNTGVQTIQPRKY